MFRVAGHPRVLTSIVCCALLGVAVAACLFMSGEALATNGQEPIGWGQRAVARGGADVAVGGGPLSMNQNPATLAQLARREVEIGPQWLYTDQHFRNVRNRKAGRLDNVLLPNLALGWPVGDTCVVGIGVFAQAGLGSDYKINAAMFPNEYMDVDADFSLAKIAAGAAIKITDDLMIGATLNVGQAEMDMRAVVGPAWLAIDKAKGTGIGGTVGVLYQATKKLRLGAAYFTPIWFHDLKADRGMIRTSPLIPGPPISPPAGAAWEYKNVSLDGWTFPQKFAVGANYDATDKWRLMGELRWVQNGTSSFDRQDAKFRQGRYNAPDMTPDVGLKQKDQFIWIFGTEYDVLKNLTVAAGYNYGRSPVRDRYLFPVAPAITEHHLTMGVRYHTKNFYVGLAYVRAFTKKLRSGSYNAIDGGVDYGAARNDHDQHSVMLGAGLNF